MKKIIKKYWGIVLIVTLLASMFVTAAPVSADDLEFSAVGTPGGVTNPYQIADTNVQMVKVAPGGTIFTLDIGHDMMYRSVDGGYTWKATDLTDYDVADFVFSPSFETDSTMFLVVNDGADVLVLRSVNGGVSFTQLGGAVATAETAMAIDVEPTYMSGVGMIVVGTNNDAYVWGLGGALNWVMLGGGGVTGESVLDIAFSPLYPIDSTIFAVTNDGAATYLEGIVQAGTWNNLSGAPDFPVELGTNPNVNAALMVFPSDFNASLPLARNIFVGIDGDDSGVFRMNNQSATEIGDFDAVYSLNYGGTSASGALYVGLLEKDGLDVMVYKSSNPGASVAVVAFSPLYAGLTGDRKAAVATNGSTLYVGTSGNESAFNVSADGLTFRQNGQIDTVYNYTTDLKVVSPTEWYIATAADAGYLLESLWLTTNGGAQYQRIATIDSDDDWAGIALSQNFATDNTMYSLA